jgi:hypothetical protein
LIYLVNRRLHLRIGGDALAGKGVGTNVVRLADEGHDWSTSTGRSMAANLVAVAAAREARPIPPSG